MNIILMKDVPKLGSAGDMVNVKPGYARNFLLPNGSAITASVKNKKRLEHEKKLASFAQVKAQKAATSVADKLKSITVEVTRKVGEQDKLFGSVTTLDIFNALKEKDMVIDRRQIRLSDPIKALGEYTVPVKLHRDIAVELKVVVSAAEEE